MKKYYSIFNDVLGPIMTGPSSSHTAACARIGKMTNCLYGNKIEEVEIIFEKNGSYPSTYKGQGSDYGFVGGLLGFFPEDERLKDALDIAKNNNIKITFKSEDFGMNHPNEAAIRIYKNKKIDMEVMTCSIGGGMFEITKMDNFDVKITGENKKVYIAVKESFPLEEIKSLLNEKDYFIQRKNDLILFEISIKENEIEDKINYLKTDERVVFYRTAEVILPIGRNNENIPIFYNAQEALVYNKEKNLKMWELAMKYECNISSCSEEEIYEKMKNILKAMRKSLIINKEDKYTKLKILTKNSSEIEEKLKTAEIINIGILNKIIISAIKVMENNCKHNIVVAAPTAGSCGVIPATLISCGEFLEADEEKVIHSLLAAGLIGVFIANQATFGAEVAGCQAENGAASAMAAAGVIELLSGTLEEGFQAAALALENLLGLICDPVGGLTEIPCISRNVLASINSISSANMVKCGYDPIIPLDQVILSMFKVGTILPEELRCTCKGGLCDTVIGKEIYEKIKISQ